MKTILSYVIVIIISQFCLTAGAFVGMILGLTLFWLPEKIHAPLCTFFGGIAGSMLAVTVAFLLFQWIVGPGSFGWGPFLAATLPLAIPIHNDYKKSLELRLVQSELPERVAAHAAPTTLSLKTAVMGELIGIIMAGMLFL